MSVLELLKDDVVDGKGNAVDIAAFTGEGKVFGLFFSAHWCPPCRGFTQKLIQFYTSFKEKNPQSSFEIVFVSSDKQQADFNKYFKEMPWLALKYAKRDEKATLSKKFGVSGIPAFIILDGSNGSLINGNGRSVITDDSQGLKYPWRPPTFTDIVKGNLVKHGTNIPIDSAVLSGKIKLLYFSALWCPPCQSFTLKLVDLYNSLKSSNVDLELIFVSSDHDVGSFVEYLATMPWYAIPFKDERIAKLTVMFEVEGIPNLIVLDKNDKIITDAGRAMVNDDPKGSRFPWRKQPIEALGPSAVNAVNDGACVVYFTDGKEASIELAKAAMGDIAMKYYANGDEQELYFLYSTGDEMATTLKEMIDLRTSDPSLIIIDQGEDLYTCNSDSLTKDTVETFISDYRNGKLSPTSI